MIISLTVKLDMRYEVSVRWNGVHTLSLPQVPNHHLLILAAGGYAISETQAMFHQNFNLIPKENEPHNKLYRA